MKPKPHCHALRRVWVAGALALLVGLPRANAAGLDDIEPLVTAALAEHKLPGCVVVVGRADGIVYQRAFGARAVQPAVEPMTMDTIFDLASLTKPVATATAILLLAERGQLDLDERVARYIPEFGQGGKNAITLRHLLTHVSGLPADTPVDQYAAGRAAALRRIYALVPRAAPGMKFAYSDVGYLVLEEIIRRVAKTDLASFAEREIFAPLGMRETGFRPSADLRPRIAPTEKRSGQWIRGEVHDPRAFRLGGVAGHAGLFSTAADLSRFARMVLGRGTLEGRRLLSATSMARMLAAHDVPGGIRALGWDMRSGYSSNRGEGLSRRAVGHGGYTGTSLWVDPAQDLFVLFLSNRVHPDGKGAVNGLAGAIGTLAARAFYPTSEVSEVKAGLELGIDALRAQNFALLAGRRIALLTNDGARTRDGQRTTDVLAGRPEFKLVALLSPEHGLSASRDELVRDGKDAKTGQPIFSLYGGSRVQAGKRPAGPRRVELPPDIDMVVVDLPDVGARFFTYASTLHASMRAAAERGLPLVVLDRPNPLNGVDVAGPLLKPDLLSPVNHHPLPIRHGMTMGELAEMMLADEHLPLDLRVVTMAGYDRRGYFDQTGLAWWPPSPNLRDVNQAVLYPGVALLEASNVSVGRGTDTPFEVVGAPWIDGEKLSAALTNAGLAGVSFQPAQFTPQASVHAGKPCQGVRLKVDDRATFEPVRTGLALAIALRKLYREQWLPGRLSHMLGDTQIAEAVLKPSDLPAVEALWKDELEAFRAKRAKYLLYPLQP